MMVNVQNGKNILLLGAVLLSLEVLGNKLTDFTPADTGVIIVASVVLAGGLWFHVIKG